MQSFDIPGGSSVDVPALLTFVFLLLTSGPMLRMLKVLKLTLTGLGFETFLSCLFAFSCLVYTLNHAKFYIPGSSMVGAPVLVTSISLILTVNSHAYFMLMASGPMLRIMNKNLFGAPSCIIMSLHLSIPFWHSTWRSFLLVLRRNNNGWGHEGNKDEFFC